MIQPEAIKCRYCGAMLDPQAKEVQAFQNSPHCILVTHPDKARYTVLAVICAVFMIGCIIGFISELPNPNLGVAVLAFLFLLLTLWCNSKIHNAIKCPCGYYGEPNEKGGTIGCLFIVLLIFGIIPGILYLLFAGESRKTCPKCGREAG
jgi:hypothetical protein